MLRGNRIAVPLLVSSLSLTVLAIAHAVEYEMVDVPAGTFIMGDGIAYCGERQRLVILTNDFSIGKFEVTNQQFMDMMQWAYDEGYVWVREPFLSVRDYLDGTNVELYDLDDIDCEIGFADGTFVMRDAGHGINPDHPLKEATWYGCARFCDWMSLQEGLPRAYEHDGDWLCNHGDPYTAVGYRLPTDAEREYVARYNDGRIYPWGNEEPCCERLNFNCGGYCEGWTVPVGRYDPAPVALDIYDLAGNLYEWCNDWWVCDVGSGPAVDPVGPSTGSSHVLRGGGWAHGAAAQRSAARYAGYPGPSPGIGFRVARSAARIGVEVTPLTPTAPRLQGRPNPFRTDVAIDLWLETEGVVTVDLFDLQGRLVRHLLKQLLPAGHHAPVWDGHDDQDQKLAAGTYLARVQSGGTVYTGRVVLLR